MSVLGALWRDVSLPAVVAGFVTVLVGFTSSAAIVFEAARALGADDAQVASWMWALGLGMAVTCIGLSLRWRAPVVTAWSTPGAALIATSAAGVPMAEAIGAFVVCGILILAAGASGVFERAMARIPQAIASALLAGVLVRFGLQVFTSMQSQFWLVAAMCAAYLLGRRAWPRYAVPLALGAGVAVAFAGGLVQTDALRLQWASPVFTPPQFSVQAIVGLGLPLFVVTMASQNVPGVAVMRAAGYATPVSPLIGWTGVATTLLAPFGAYALNLAAITAAIAMGREAHEDPARRYVAAVAAGVFYLAVGLMGATVGAVFAALPRELVVAIAGLALLGTIGNGLAGALREDATREAALVTFLVTASGFGFGGIGSAFWGVVAGAIVLAVLRPQARP